jgi:hypothetical protein
MRAMTISEIKRSQVDQCGVTVKLISIAQQ